MVMGTKMPDDETDQERDGERRAPAPPNPSRIPTREVTLSHLDSPPPSGKQSIHPRRPAPIVPTREERTHKRSVDDTGPEESSRK